MIRKSLATIRQAKWRKRLYLCPISSPMSLTISVINKSKHALPEYQTEGAAGMDLRANLAHTVVLAPLERRLIPTGIFMALPMGFEAQIRPRSGMAIKKGLSLVNAVGTIDCDYRGEIMVPLINLSAEEQTIEDGERIAQMVIARYDRAQWMEVDVLESTDRGSGGFGHSGTK